MLQNIFEKIVAPFDLEQAMTTENDGHCQMHSRSTRRLCIRSKRLARTDEIRQVTFLVEKLFPLLLKDNYLKIKE